MDDRCKQVNKLFYDVDAVGTSGKVHISYAAEYSASHKLWHATLNSLGVKTNEAHLSGSNVGVWTNLGSIDPQTCTRSYSVTGYYLPIASRQNLVVLTEALVSKVVLSERRATGVCFRHNGQEYTVSASKEIILSAGTVQSPQILELSGIGNPEVLSRAGIEVKVKNLNVGEHLQDHMSKSRIA